MPGFVIWLQHLHPLHGAIVLEELQGTGSAPLEVYGMACPPQKAEKCSAELVGGRVRDGLRFCRDSKGFFWRCLYDWRNGRLLRSPEGPAQVLGGFELKFVREGFHLVVCTFFRFRSFVSKEVLPCSGPFVLYHMSC